MSRFCTGSAVAFTSRAASLKYLCICSDAWALPSMKETERSRMISPESLRMNMVLPFMEDDGTTVSELNSTAAADDTHNHDDERHDQQDVNETAHGIGRDNAQEPQDEENDGESV